MASALREIAAFFGIEVDTEQLEKADSKIQAFIGKVKEGGKILAEAVAAEKIGEFLKSQVENATKLQNMSERLDVSVEQIKEFGFAAASAGLDADSAAGMLQRFERATSGAGKHGAAAAAELAKLGVKTQGAGAGNTVDTMLQLADAFQKMPTRAEKVAAAVKLFGRQGISMIPILEKGRASMEALFQESRELGNGLGPDFYNNAKEVNEVFEHMQFGIQSLKERALATVLPYLQKLGSWLLEVTRKTIEFTKHTNVLKTLAIAIAVALGSELLPAIGAVLAALAPFAIPVAIITALYLIFDDLYTLMTGGQSVIGDTLDALFGLGTAKQFAIDLTEAFDGLLDVLGDIGSMLKDTVMGALEEVLEAAKGVGEALGDIAGGNFKQAWQDLQKSGNNMDKIAQKRGAGIVRAAQDVGDVFTGTSADVRKVRRNNRRVAAGGEGTILPPEYGPNTGGTGTREVLPVPGHEGGKAAAAGNTTTVHQTNHNNVTVHGAHDTEKAGKAAAGGIEQGVKRANLNAQKAANVP